MKGSLLSLALTLASAGASAAWYDYSNYSYADYAATHLSLYGLSSGYLAGVNSAYDSAKSFLAQDIGLMSRGSGLSSPWYSPNYSSYYNPYYIYYYPGYYYGWR